MSEDRARKVEWMREEALKLAGPYTPSSEPFSALVRAADALREAANAVSRYEARR